MKLYKLETVITAFFDNTVNIITCDHRKYILAYSLIINTILYMVIYLL